MYILEIYKLNTFSTWYGIDWMSCRRTAYLTYTLEDSTWMMTTWLLATDKYYTSEHAQFPNFLPLTLPMIDSEPCTIKWLFCCMIITTVYQLWRPLTWGHSWKPPILVWSWSCPPAMTTMGLRDRIQDKIESMWNYYSCGTYYNFYIQLTLWITIIATICFNIGFSTNLRHP